MCKQNRTHSLKTTTVQPVPFKEEMWKLPPPELYLSPPVRLV